MSTDQLKTLLEKFAEGRLNDHEKKEFIESLHASSHQAELEELIDKNFSDPESKRSGDPETLELIYRMIMDKKETVRSGSGTVRRMWLRIAAAASVILIAGVAVILSLSKDDAVKENSEIVTAPVDVKAPETNRALITLADGKKVYLDNVANGELAQQSNVIVTKTADGKIVYSGVASEIVYNTLTNPRGSKVIDITLADGSRVWLNAESSLKYPVAFVGSERKVEITGEAYFEAAPSNSPNGGEQKRPFIVEKGDMQVIVLGTKFNVNAYDDESDIKVTLLEGSVEVNNEKSKVKIRPGQQAVLTPDSRLTTHGSPDLDLVMAWKNGTFYFDNAGVKTILQQFARWYDVEVIYEGSVSNRTFFGIVSRSSTLSEVLKILKANDIKFRIDGKKLYVTGA